MLSFIANLFKYVGLILTPTLAIVAFTQKTRDEKTGRLTRVGKRYVGLIIVSAAITLASAAVENARQARGAAEQLKRNTFLLEQVLRGQYPLQGIKASYQFDVPATWPGITKYEAELDARMPNIAANAASQSFRKSNDIWLLQSASDGSNHVLRSFAVHALGNHKRAGGAGGRSAQCPYSSLP